MIDIIIATTAGFFAAVIGAMGMGGGGILLLYLSAFAGVSQLNAQGINLISFVPVAVVSLFFHAKNKLIVYKAAILSVISGAIGVFVGGFIAGVIDEKILTKCFALFLLYIGIKELFYSPKKKN